MSVCRSITALLTSTCVALQPVAAFALPQGGVVSTGNASISTSGTQTTINQSTNRAILDWSSFNVSSGEAVQFNQPSGASVSLNRIHDANPSSINGNITANGNVWLVNNNGILFGQNAMVNVGGLLATSSDIDNDKFMAGDDRFTHAGNSNATISNAGHIKIADGGFAALVGPHAINSGVIEAKLGKVALASGDNYAVDLFGDGLINVQAGPAITDQLVGNGGIITADGGDVLLTAAAAQNSLSSLIDIKGIIQAESVAGKQGHITVYAEGSNAVKGNVAANKGKKTGDSTVIVSGVLDASGYDSGEQGGDITITADNVGILSGALLDTSGDIGGGTLKIGGDFHGQGSTPTSLITYVDPGAYILANAITRGDGGNIAIWSDGRTDFYGNIYARGGSQSGNGGFVETSGHLYLDPNGYVDLTAAHGKKGLYLLDPDSVTITGGTDSTAYDNSGLLAYWAFNEASGGTAYDSSGNGNNGSYVGSGPPAPVSSGAPVPYANPLARYFYNRDIEPAGWVNVPTSGSLQATSLSLSFWMKEPGGTAYLDGVFTTNAFQIFRSNQATGYSGPGVISANLPGSQSVDINGNYTLDQQWHNYVLTVDTTTHLASVYVDGTLMGQSSYTGNAQLLGTNQIYIGGFTPYSPLTYRGYLDDVRVYNNDIGAAGAAELYGSSMTVQGLQALSQTADVAIQATHGITLDFKGDTLTLASDRNISFTTTNGNITSASAGTIYTTRTGSGGNVSFDAGGSGNISLSNMVFNTGTGVVNFAAGGSVFVDSLSSLNLGAVSGTAISMRSRSGDISINGALNASASGDALTLIAGRNFINNFGSNALSAPGGRWLVYAANPANSVLGGVSADFTRYNCAFGGFCLPFGYGNGLLYNSGTYRTEDITSTIRRVDRLSAPVSSLQQREIEQAAPPIKPAIQSNLTVCQQTGNGPSCQQIF